MVSFVMTKHSKLSGVEVFEPSFHAPHFAFAHCAVRGPGRVSLLSWTPHYCAIVRVSSLENPSILSSARKSSLFVLSVRFNRSAETATC